MDGVDLDRLNGLYAKLLVALRDREAPAGPLNAAMGEILALHGEDIGGRDLADDLVDAMSLLPYGTWFHWNHFGFQVVPNRPVPGVPMTNATDYYPEGGMRDGAPVAYEAMGFDSRETRERLPRLVCQAVFMSRRAPLLKALARRDGRFYVVQTGQGPLLASPEGKLVEVPYDAYVTADGRVVPHDEKAHGHARIEAPDA